MNNVKKFDNFLNEEFVKKDISIVDLINLIKVGKVVVNKYEFKEEVNYEFELDSEFTLSVDLDDDSKTLFIDGVESTKTDKEVDLLYDFLLHYDLVKESTESIFLDEINERSCSTKKKKKKNKSKNIISEKSNVVKFDEFINEARISKENKVIKDIIDELEDVKELKVKYTENKSSKLLVDIEFKFKINEDSYIFTKQKSKTSVTEVTVTKNGEKILTEVVNNKSLLALVNKLDSILISFVKKSEVVKEELNIDDEEFSEDEKVFDEDDEESDDINYSSDGEAQYSSDELKEVDSLLYLIRSCGIDNIEIEQSKIETQLESDNYFEFSIDDENYIFEFSDKYFYVEKDGVEIISIDNIEDNELKNKIETIKEEIVDIFNEKSKDINNEVEETFESKRLKSFKVFQYIEEDDDDIDIEYKITCED